MFSSYFSILYCLGLIDDLEKLEYKVKQQISALQQKCVLILIANHNSYSKAVNYIIDNFTTLDILSKEIDFQLVGYTNDKNIPLESSRIAKDEILNQALDELDSMLPDENISQERIMEFREKLISLKSISDAYDEDYQGDTRKTKINSKRLGTIWFQESKFSSFVSDLIKATHGKYNYSGGCDLVIIPFINKEFKYDNCKIYSLDSIVNEETNLSLDGFLFGILKIIRQNEGCWTIPSLYTKSFKDALYEFEQCINSFIQLYDLNNQNRNVKRIKDEALRLIEDYKKPFLFIRRKKRILEKADSILSDFRKEYDGIVFSAIEKEIDQLYSKATSKVLHPSQDEVKQKLIRDIERHLHWKLTENFFFISYSTKDKTKAELIRNKLEEHNARVWIAPDGIPQGRDYASVIPTTLRCTKNFVLILTKNSAKSQWVLREIDSALNNSQALLRIVLADGFSLNDYEDYEDLKFYLNKVQISYRYEDIIQEDNLFKEFMN